MANLKFAHTHNMVAFLSKPTESEGFEQIVDFLNAHPIKYALTINPTIYISCIEQFWSTVKAKTINGEQKLQALVDGKKVIITESTVRRYLQLEDEEGVDCLPNATIFEKLALIGPKTTAWNEFSSTMASVIICKFLMYPRFVQVFLDKQLDGMSTNNGIYIAPSHTKKILGNMRRVGKGFSGRVTPLFTTMVVQNQVELGEDEAIHKELGDSLVRDATTTSSLEAEQDSGNITKTRSKATPNKSSSLGTTLGGGPRCQETMGDTIAQTRFENKVLDLEKAKTTQANEIARLKRRVKKVEKKISLRTHKLKRLYKVGLTTRVESSGDEENLGEDASKQGRRINAIDADKYITLVSVQDEADKEMFDVDTLNVSTAATIVTRTTEEITLAQALADLKSTKSKAKGIAFRYPGESTTTIFSQQLQDKGLSQDKGKGILVEPEKPLKKKYQLKLDEEIALKLMAEIDEEERIARAKEEKIDEANIAWDDIQEKVDADYQLAERLQAEDKSISQLKKKPHYLKNS
ncbi:hypothetical protein Tco_0002549 [Tanacetum coccineum]